MYSISIHKDNDTQIYSQTVVDIDLMAVIQAVNSVPNTPKKKPRKDKGVPRKKEQETVIRLEGK